LGGERDELRLWREPRRPPPPEARPHRALPRCGAAHLYGHPLAPHLVPAESNPSTSVRVGLVGLGGHGRTIQAAAEAAPGLTVAAVFDPDEGEAALAAERFGCAAAPSYEGLIARGDLDAVALVTPNAAHRPQAEAAFRAGLDVFVEKPI